MRDEPSVPIYTSRKDAGGCLKRQEANVVSVVRDSSNVYRHPNHDLAQCTLRLCFLSQAGRTWVVVKPQVNVDLKNSLLWNITLAQNSRCAR